MSTMYTSTQRTSTSTEKTLAGQTHTYSDNLTSYVSKKEYFDDDEKTLSDLALNDDPSSHGKTTLRKTVTHLRSKLGVKEDKPKKKGPLPADYYPSTLRTFEALAASRI